MREPAINSVDIFPGDLVFTWQERKLILFRFLGYSATLIWGHVVTSDGLSTERITFPIDMPVVDVIKHLEPGQEKWLPPGGNV